MPEQFTRPLLVLGTRGEQRRDGDRHGRREPEREDSDRLSRALHALATQVRQLRR
ncbi:hypothetical protein L3Q67_22060 [Saccharothrix sp. AJ9571]|nr:hypothetical protein L3Q67_22060 [Saccharothrix sp. AJ9571]